ncbi:MAG: glycosyltransferase WbuB, partial [Erysipelotrichaceae bacterium]
EEIPYYLGAADAALLILKPDPVFEMTIPAKLQTYFACGIPILGCVSGEAKRIILESNAGLVSDSLTVEGFVKICREFKMKSKEEISKLKINSLKYGNQNFDKDSLLDELEKYMEELTL